MGETYDRNRYPIPGSNQRQPASRQSAVSRSLQEFDTDSFHATFHANDATATGTTRAREGKMAETTTASEQSRRVTSSSSSWSIPVDAAAGDPPASATNHTPLL